MIQSTMTGFPPPPSAALSQWDTPRDLAERIANWAGIKPGMRVLEPSAGIGALAFAARDLGAEVVCCEIDPARATILDKAGFVTVNKDFLQAQLGDYDLALLNPPFENDQDAAHIEQALCCAPHVVAHVPISILCGVGNHKALWGRHTLERIAYHIRRPSYGGAYATGRCDMVTIQVKRGRSVGHISPVSVEWWP